MKFVIESADMLKHRENNEYAAWYTNMQAVPGEYEIVHKPGQISGGYYGEYFARIAAVVTDDYFAAHYGGVAVTAYDTTKNAGTPTAWTVQFTPLALLRNPYVVLSDEEYDCLLTTAIESELNREPYTRQAMIDELAQPLVSTDCYEVVKYRWELNRYQKLMELLEELTQSRNHRNQARQSNGRYPLDRIVKNAK